MTTRDPVTPPEPRPSNHDGWTPEPQEQIQPGDPWRDYGRPLTPEEVRFVRKHRTTGYVADLPAAVSLIDSLLATLDGLDALEPIRALRISPDQIEAALASLGPTGDKAEAYVKVAAQAAAASLARLGEPR